MPKANTSGLDSSEYYQPEKGDADKLQLVRSRFADQRAGFTRRTELF